MIPAGMVELVTIAATMPGGERREYDLVVMRETDEAFFSYPGDVSWCKPDFERVRSRGLLSIAKVEAMLGLAVEARAKGWPLAGDGGV